MTLPDGLKARYRHERLAFDHGIGHVVRATHYVLWSAGLSPLPRGGLTTCRQVTDDGAVVAEAQARCSKRDNYNKRLGRSIALGRALDEYLGTGEDRRARAQRRAFEATF